MVTMTRKYAAVGLFFLALFFCFFGLVLCDEMSTEGAKGCGDSSEGCLVGVGPDEGRRTIGENNGSLVEEGRKRGGGGNSGSKGGQQQKGIMERILPMMIMPFMISTGMIPMMLISLKMMMLKSALIGKIAIILMLINMFRNRSNRGGVFTHNIMGGGGAKSEDKTDWIMQEHYGYQGEAEYGAYISKRRRRRRKRNVVD
ncbi:unnamed protein product [Callosobruchus maculatus]|uniref:Uncharacterized protein n=1 Tax=Callosobruchus maculatus TaxID=64391 RepID=A0A653BML7_CALMS|nr:unnamed protein product [Callosobruchus maculatus]